MTTTYDIIFTVTADECLLNIAEYIAQDNRERAETFIEEIIESLYKILSILPFSGKIYEEIENIGEIRSLTYKNYVSFYRIVDDTVEILYIFHSAKNIQEIFGSMSEHRELL